MRICLSVTVDDLIKNIDYLNSLNENFIVEVRLDIDVEKPFNLVYNVLNKLNKNVIFTIRSRDEGGRYNKPEKERYLDYLKVLSFNPDYIDIEINSKIFYKVADAAHKIGVKVIGSYHNFKYTPSLRKLEEIFFKARDEEYADIIKIVTYADDYKDNLTIFNFLKKHAYEYLLISFCMGRKGSISRVFSPLLGSWLTYACLENQTASGQIPIKTFEKILDELL